MSACHQDVEIPVHALHEQVFFVLEFRIQARFPHTGGLFKVLNTRLSEAVLPDRREIPSEVLERQEFRLLLQQAITDLPLIYREIFLLRDVEELSVDESAEVLGITVASVKVRLHRARIMLQKKLVPQLKKANPKRRWFSWS